MKVVPGDALLHNVHGAAARPRHPQIVPQAPDPPQGGVEARPVQDRVRAASTHAVERPLPQQPGRPMPRGSALDITV